MLYNSIILLYALDLRSLCTFRSKNYELSHVFHQYIPHGDDMAQGADQHEEVEHGVHIPFPVERIEHGTCDVSQTLRDNPYDGSRRYRVDERLEGYQHGESHAHEAERLDIRMLLQLHKTDHRADDGTQPYEREQRPAPVKGKG